MISWFSITISTNTLFFKKKLWASKFDQLKLNIIKEIYDQFVSEHSNICRTCKYLNKWYYWSQTKKSINRYIRNCHICKKFKATRDKYFDLLNSLLISNKSWTDIVMKFVIKLSKTKNDFNVILMMINKLIKMHHYVLCVTKKDDTSAEKTIKLLIDNVWRLHELSSIIISNRDSQFVSLVWKTVCKMLKINVKLFTAFHFETNNQSEIVNQKMRRYLRDYYNYQQNDWFEWLFMIEFIFNVTISTFIELFVFMTNYEFESRLSFESSDSNDSNERLSIKKRMLTQKAIIIARKMKNIWDFIKKKLAYTQNIQKKYVDEKRAFCYVIVCKKRSLSTKETHLVLCRSRASWRQVRHALDVCYSHRMIHRARW